MKYLVATLVRDQIIGCCIVGEPDLKDAISNFLKLSWEPMFDIDAFINASNAGNTKKLSNGTTLQFLYLPE